MLSEHAHPVNHNALVICLEMLFNSCIFSHKCWLLRKGGPLTEKKPLVKLIYKAEL